MPFGRKSPLEALALPGVILAYKYSQFRQRRREAASRRVTERELSALHHKIDKLLSKLEESEPEPPTSQEDECVICINARATMQTSPCGHRVVCRRCFVKTIQSAVAQRLLPLRCVICRARVNRLTSSSGTWRIQESASSYSVGAKSWSSGSGSSTGVPQSASSYSVGSQHLSVNQHSNHHNQHHNNQQNNQHHHYNSNHNHNHHYNGGSCGRNRVAQSASLYSMQSGTSSVSNSSNATNCSNTSSMSSGTDSSISASSCSSAATSASSYSSNTSCGINSLSSSSSSNYHSHHNHPHSTCPTGCSGAIPRKPSIIHGIPTANTYPGRRYTKGRIADLQQNRLPPIKEFRSPAKVPHPSPVHLNNPRFRYASYTKSPSHETVPLLNKDPSPSRPTSQQSSSSASTLTNKTLKSSAKPGLTSKVNPTASKIPVKNSLTSPKNLKNNSNHNNIISNMNNNNNTMTTMNSIKVKSSKVELNHPSSSKSFSFINSNNSNKTNSNSVKINNNSNKNYSTLSFNNINNKNQQHHHHQDEKADNKKNETMEKKKKEEKLKIKAEKEARKEEKRLAKEEERLAKILAKEEKKKGKREAKELLLANDGNSRK
ncbi:probable serine/threonine-protein kinase DDB_G0282963 [Condylostylus longicornis]|uniref:probable serine/threonine-protein kinase DDB_G0282963 n=1 Tax=Condylostylus longicornis TaxID=2530218 RepID=UPI00244E3908|nr:probable serine/threonine-protein kinase DDB_G0282963 [Condylostylus longicornis]